MAVSKNGDLSRYGLSILPSPACLAFMAFRWGRQFDCSHRDSREKLHTFERRGTRTGARWFQRPHTAFLKGLRLRKCAVTRDYAERVRFRIESCSKPRSPSDQGPCPEAETSVTRDELMTRDCLKSVRAMPSPVSLIELRLRQVNRPSADSNWRRALAVVLALILAATGLTDSVRSQSVAKQIPDANTSVRNENSTGAAKTRVAEPQQFNVIVAAHAYLVQGKIAQNIVLTDWKLVTWDELHSLVREGAKVRPTTIEAYITNSLQFPNPKFNDVAKRFYEFHKEQGARVILVSAGSNASKRYDAIRNADDLKTDRLPRRAGTLLLPDGRPAAGATVLLCEKSQYQCGIDLDNGKLSNPAEEFWASTDAQGHFTLYSKDEHFAVVALHPSGIAVATGKELEYGRPLRLEPWARIKLKGYAEVGLTASRPAYGKDAIQLEFSSRARAAESKFPPGRVSVQRFLKNRLFDTQEIEVAPGETIDVDVRPPTANSARPDK